MVNAVQNDKIISFPQSQQQPKQIHAMDKVTQEQLYNPGLYAVKEIMTSPDPRPRSRDGIISKTIRFIGNIVLLTGAVCGSAVLARNHIKSIKDVILTDKLTEDAKFGEKFKYYTAKLAEAVKEEFKKLVNKSSVLISPPPGGLYV